MPFRYLHGVAAAAAVVSLLTVSAAAQVRASKRDAQTMKQKVAAIASNAGGPAKQSRRTTVTENEVNSYLTYELGDDLPAGVVEPSVTALGPGRVLGRAVVDLDAVRKSAKSTGLFDLRSYLTGHLPVTATGVLRTSNGRARFDLESATVGVVPIPKLILQEIVAYYSKTPAKPGGISLDEEFALPARIREIQVERGQATVVQ
jgi:hypothetical protein